jgi:hypothetical protein
MGYYKLVPIVNDFPFGDKPNIPVGTNYEAKSYDRVGQTCKVKTLRDEVLNVGIQITEEEYLEN